MQQAYLIVTGKNIDRDDVTALLDKRSEIVDWFTGFSSAIFAIGKDVTAKQISGWIKAELGSERHFVTEVSENNAGWLPKSYWPKLP
jgi:hypothetical protein